MHFIARLFNQHKIVRRVTLAWACWLITVIALRVTEPEVFVLIDGPKAAAIGTLVGVLATVIGFYKYLRSQDDERNGPTQ